VLERRFEQPVTAVRVNALERVNLNDFDVVVLPSGTYALLAGDEPLRRLREWMLAGGTLVTMAESSRWAASVKLLETPTELRGGKPDVPPPPGNASGGAGATPSQAGAEKGAFAYETAIQPERERPENTPGGILRVTLDQEHWLSSGQDADLQVLVESNRVFTPIRLDKGRTSRSGRGISSPSPRNRTIAPSPRPRRCSS
jgi:hypothetical protein